MDMIINKGLLFCSIQVNDASGRFLIDTGAQESIISDSAKFNTVIDPEYEITVSGTGGQMDCKRTKPCKVDLGVIPILSLTFNVFGLGDLNEVLTEQGIEPIDGIIGADILVESRAIIDYANSKIIF